MHHLLPALLEHIENGDLNPEVIITHKMPLEKASEAYRMFDQREQDCRKIILTP